MAGPDWPILEHQHAKYKGTRAHNALISPGGALVVSGGGGEEVPTMATSVLEARAVACEELADVAGNHRRANPACRSPG
eukprot:4442540-Alexandrium_andersonii.AAC.1